MAYLGVTSDTPTQIIPLPLDVASGGTASNNATSAKIALGVISAANDGTIVESGTTAQRGSPTVTKVRYNIDTSGFEGATGSNWTALGGAKNDVFYVNKNILNANTTINAGENAMSAGPVTVADGVTVTISSGATWTIVGG